MLKATTCLFQMMPNSRMTMNSETPKFPKPELKVKKSFYMQGNFGALFILNYPFS